MIKDIKSEKAEEPNLVIQPLSTRKTITPTREDSNELLAQLEKKEKKNENRFYFENGNYYEGNWLSGQIHGYGTLYYKDG